jgi:hypothetical protein
MRKLFFAVLVTLVLASPLSVLAKEIELSPVPANQLGTYGHLYPVLPLLPSEQELYNDNGSSNYYWTGYTVVNTINITYNCWLVRLKDYIYDYNGSTSYITGDVLGDSGGTPTWTSIIGGHVNVNYSGYSSWGYSADFSPPVWFANGTVTHPGQYASSSSGGICTDTNYSGSGYCWIGDPSYGWYGDYTPYFGHCMARLIVNNDTTPPYADTFSPADGGTGQPNVIIGFHVRDDDAGVNSNSIAFDAANSKGDISGTLHKDDSNPNDVVCTFTPNSDLTVGDTITCTVHSGLTDRLGNVNQSSFVWTFTVIPYTNLQPTSLGYIKAQYQ